MRGLSYTFADSADAAVASFANAGGSVRYIAGGTTLYDLMKLGIEHPAHLIDVSRIEGLDTIDTDGGVLRFGSRALMADVAHSPVVRNEYPVLSESLLKAASQQLRNMATVGGEEKLRAAIASAFAQKTFAEWTRIFAEREACVTPVLTAREAMESDHARARGTVITVDDPVEGKLRHVGNPIRFDRHAFNSLRPAPDLGADNDCLLSEIGYSTDEIAEMRGTHTI